MNNQRPVQGVTYEDVIQSTFFAYFQNKMWDSILTKLFPEHWEIKFSFSTV